MAGSDEHQLLLQVSYDLARLQKQNAAFLSTVDGGLTAVERRAANGAANIENALSLKRVDFGKALDKVFDSSKLAVLEEGSAHLRIFGSALEPLGPIGIAAGAGVAALAVGIERVLKAGEWAEELKRASSTLGITTTQLQQFDFAFQSLGIDVGKGREALSGLERTIGLVASGAARAQQVKIFTEGLKITPEQLRGWGTLPVQMGHVLDSLSKLDAETRAGFASRLKVDPEVLNSLVTEREEFEKAIDTFHQYHLAIGPDVIDQSAKAQGEMRALSAIVDQELKKDFIELEPALVAVASVLVDMFRNITDVITGVKAFVGDIGDAWKGLQSFNDKADQAVPFLHDLDTWFKNATGSGGVLSSTFDTLRTTLGYVINPLSVVVDLLRQMGAAQNKLPGAVTRRELDTLLHPTPKSKQLITPTGHKGHEPHDNTDAATASATEAVDRANKALADALRNLTGDIQARADFEEDATNAEAAATVARLEAERQKIAKDQTIDAAHARILDAMLVQAEDETEAAADAKNQKTQRDAAFALEDKQIDVHKDQVDAQIAELQSQSTIALTTKDRIKAERRILALRQQLERDLESTQLDRALQLGEISQAQHDAQLKALQQTQSAETATFNFNNPGDVWDQKLQELAHAAGDASDALAQMKADALDEFNSSLFNATGGLNSLSDVAKNVIHKLDTDIEQQGLKVLENAVFSGSGPLGGIGKFLGLGGGSTKPTGSAGDPIFTKSADAGGAGGLGGLGGSGGLGSLFSGLFGGGGAGTFADGSSVAASGLAGLFAGGGSFMVGGRGGIDKNIVSLRATAGERVTVETPEQQRNGGMFGSRSASVTVVTPDADSFRASKRQIARSMRHGLGLQGA